MMMVSLEKSSNCGGWLLLGEIWAQMGSEVDGGISLFSEAIRKLCQAGKIYCINRQESGAGLCVSTKIN